LKYYPFQTSSQNQAEQAATDRNTHVYKDQNHKLQCCLFTYFSEFSFQFFINDVLHVTQLWRHVVKLPTSQ